MEVYRLPEMREAKITAHFKVKEFACKDGSPVVFVDPELVQVLETIRACFDSPVIVNSGYRSIGYNAKIGGAVTSYHCCGMAADVTVKGVSPARVADLVRRVAPDRYGVGIYPTFTHIDVRPVRADWKKV